MAGAQKTPPQIVLAKNALQRINLGQSFAEYDPVLMRPGVFVRTPATDAAEDVSRSKCFFVGRRGTGKTAITLYLEHKARTTALVHPTVLVPHSLPPLEQEFLDPRKRPFRSLIAAFEMAILYEAVAQLIDKKLLGPNSLGELGADRNVIQQFDFDGRLLHLFDDTLVPLNKNDEHEWLRQIKRPQHLAARVDGLFQEKGVSCTLIIDRIDDAWDGSDKAVICLMGLMHACVELTPRLHRVRPLLFLRENIFDRVRRLDPEFARLETAAVSLDWTHELLLELVERRLSLPFNTKLPLRGPTWDYFFPSEAGYDSRKEVFDYCQSRPRDVLTYCAAAIESAQSRRQERVGKDDLMIARKRFSENRLKDLGDEYSENFPRIHLVLSRFYGLGSEFTINAVSDFIRQLLDDAEIKEACKSWIYNYTAPEQLIEVLFNIGFAGIKNGAQTFFRSVGVRAAATPTITPNSNLVVHPTYHDALNLQSVLVTTLAGRELRATGVVEDLPAGISLLDYIARLDEVQNALASTAHGMTAARKFEDLVGDILKLCFFRVLANLQEKSRDVGGSVIRDWIAANVGPTGFWEMIRQKHGSTQVVWECKNYADLSADDFHQVCYYLNDTIGHVGFLVFRGELKDSYYEHIRRVADKFGSVILLVNESDLSVFIRQAKNGKVKDGHIRERYDATVRKIS